MLSYIGVWDLDPAQNTTDIRPGIVTGAAGGGKYSDVKFALSKLNSAMQFIFREGPSSLSERPGGSVIKAPRTVTITVTQFSSTVTISSGWESDMFGCSIVIAGDGFGENTILSQTRLRRPWPAASGTFQGTVYHDCLSLAADVRTIIEPIELPEIDPLIVLVTSQADFDTFNSGYVGTQKRSAQPRAAMVDAIFNGTALPVKVLKLNPMPDAIYPIRWREKLDPVPFTMADVIASGDEAAGPFTDPAKLLPVHWPESVLLPIATELFMSHPSFSNPSAAQAIQREAAIARSIMIPDEAVSRAPAKAHYPNKIPCRR